MDDRTTALTARALLAPMPRAAMLQFMSLLPLATADVEALVARAVEENPALDRGAGWTCGTCGRFCRSRRCGACSVTTRPADPVATVDWREELRRLVRLEVPRELFAQVEAVVDRGLADPVLLAIVDGWLPAVAAGEYAEIAASLGVAEGRVRAGVAVLRPCTRPFVSLASSAPRAGPVDVEFSVHQGQLVASVVDSEGLGLHLVNDFGDLDRQARAWLAPYRQGASRLVAAVDACFGGVQSTLDRVAAAIAGAPTATDAVLAAELGRRGTPIARRTVTKYRALLRGTGANPSSLPT